MTKILDERSGLSLSARRTAALEAMRRTIGDIAASPNVREFCVGVTARPSLRRGEYERWCARLELSLRGFVLLDWGRSADHILDSERWLFHAFNRHPKFSMPDTRRYYPSAAHHLDNQVLYLAWWTW